MKEKNTEKGSVFQGIKDFFYGISVKLHETKNKIFKKKPVADSGRNDFKKNKIREFCFIFVLLGFPTVSLFVNYIVVNVNSWLLAFQVFDVDTQTFHFEWGFGNFVKAFSDLSANVNVGLVFKNSIINYLFGFIVMSPLGWFISFSIYKKVKGSGLFIVFLFLPQIVSSIVWSMVFRYAIAYVLPKVFGDQSLGTLLHGSTAFGTMLGYRVWVNLANGMIITTGTYARIDKECVEAAEIDGCGLFKEFIYITFPHYYPIWAIGVFTGVPGIFTDMMATYEFFGGGAPEECWTIGYYFFKMIVGEQSKTKINYPVASASGLLFTIVVVPIVLITKWLVEKGDKMEGSV